jgi:hypothetical protein
MCYVSERPEIILLTLSEVETTNNTNIKMFFSTILLSNLQKI